MTTDAIPESEWVWCGYAGHFISGRNCRFHLNTRVGDYRITTVGEWATDEHPEPKSISTDYLTNPPTEYRFETMVFRVDGGGEGEVTGWDEADSARYVTSEEADAGHRAMCQKFAEAREEVRA